jgi:tRNA-dihydrouridine synthase
MISVEGASRGDKKSLRLAHFTSEERPFWVQIFGSQVEPVKKAIEIIEKII